MASRWSALGLVAATLAVSPLVPAAAAPATAGQRPTLACDPTTVVRRAAAYVGSASETFGSVIAAEDYRQQAIGPAEPERPSLPPIAIREDLHVPPPPPATSWPTSSRRHRAAFLFVRQRDDLGWVGFRDVREVDGRTVAAAIPSTAPPRVIGEPALDQWRRRTAEATRHHLGPIARRLNVPTAALLVLRPANHARFTFAAVPVADGHCQVTFQEIEEPTIVQSGIDDDVPASGALEIDAATGRVVSSELIGANRATGVASKTTVRYERDPQLRLWVPREMREEFVTRFGERFTGVAKYSDYQPVEVTARTRPEG